MSDQPEDLMLVMLRAIRGDIGEIKADMREVKERLGFLESQYASLSRRLDRVGDDVNRINTRLGLNEATPA